MNIKKINDDVVSRLKNDDREAFKYLYDEYWFLLFNQAYKRLPNEEIVKGLIQDLFADIWQNRSKLVIQTSIVAYLKQALKYKIFNYIKAQIVREKYIAKIAGNNHLPNSNQTEQQINYLELQKAISHCIASLPLQPQRVYLLKHEQDMSYLEIADHLQISVSTVEKHMIKALKIIRQQIKGIYRE
ncbi:sigma-70 family RNA polymerase sigma factor [Olivibacter sp. SDN3]|uniref:sigma-70 family RNA polymerase sigma factor n=1 Tax=Olivibacter sp. SDN3 TaxID=2764720 RepID=UPI0016515D19|nr:sigma-70 family RNA polymerase sigma factor [Olivibacter sp. SDN3]QNL49358.1 sigma-70 family RNA polymerase sigma factor [Olivibacter sp. SDN3]